MREFDRIDRICELLKALWQITPDWRFGQLVVNYFGVDPFYIEDDRVEEHMKNMIDKNNKNISKNN